MWNLGVLITVNRQGALRGRLTNRSARERRFSSHVGKHIAQCRFHLTSEIGSPGRQAVQTPLNLSVNSSIVFAPPSSNASV